MTTEKTPDQTPETLEDGALDDAQGGLTISGIAERTVSGIKYQYFNKELDAGAQLKPGVSQTSWGGDEEEPMALNPKTKLR